MTTRLQRDAPAPRAEAVQRLHTTEHETGDARWTFSLWTPAPDLQPFVASMWESRGETSWSRERLLPTGTVDLVVNLGTPAYLVDREAPASRERFAGAFVSGLHSEHLVLETAAQTHTLGVAMHAGRAGAVFGVPMHELANRVTHLDDLSGARAGSLRERLLEARSPAARFELLERWLRRRVDAGPVPDRAALWAADAIVRRGGDLRIGAVASALGVSRKELGLRFRAAVGLTPKVFARVQRFVALLARLDRGVATTLSEVAQDAGYHDHAHFTRDFRGFTGVAPSEYLERRTPYAGGIVGE